MSTLKQKINETLLVIQKHTSENYPIGIILGTGLGGLVKEMNVNHQIDYGDLPHFPLSTVESHHGKLILVQLSIRILQLCKADFIFTKDIQCSRSLILFV